MSAAMKIPTSWPSIRQPILATNPGRGLCSSTVNGTNYCRGRKDRAETSSGSRPHRDKSDHRALLPGKSLDELRPRAMSVLHRGMST